MLILASQSPRRSERLRREGVDFTVVVKDTEEEHDVGSCDVGELEERTQDNDGSTPAVEVVQYGLSLFSFQEVLKTADSTFVLFHIG